MQQITPLKPSLICFGKPQDSLVSHLALDQIKVHGENYKVCYYTIAVANPGGGGGGGGGVATPPFKPAMNNIKIH